MKRTKVLFFVFLVFCVYSLQSMPENEDDSELTHPRQLISITPADPQTYESSEIFYSQVVVRLPIPPNFRLSQVYSQPIQRGFVRLLRLNSNCFPPVIYHCSGIGLYALAVDGRTVEVHPKNGKTTATATNFTHKVFLFRLEAPQFAFWKYSYSDGTSEICPTIFAEEASVTNLFAVPSPITQIPQQILPYEITSEGFRYQPLMIRYYNGKKFQFTPIG